MPLDNEVISGVYQGDHSPMVLRLYTYLDHPAPCLKVVVVGLDLQRIDGCVA